MVGAPHHGGEVGALVEGALRGRAIAEEGDRARLARPSAPRPRRGPPRARRASRSGRRSRRRGLRARVPPAVRMAAPPAAGSSRPACRARGRSPTRGSSGRSSRRRSSAIRRAGLDRLVVPEDRVGADAALPVVDDRALVVGAQQHHPAVQLEQIALAERRRGRCRRRGRGGARASPAPSRGRYLALPRLDENGDGVALAPRTRRSSTSPRSSPSACSGSGRSQRTSIRSRSWPVETSPAVSWPLPGDDVARASAARERAPHARRGDEVEAELEAARRARSCSGTEPAYGVRVAVGDEDERGPAVPLDLERRVPAAAPLGDHLRRPSAANARSPGARRRRGQRSAADASRRADPRRSEASAVHEADVIRRAPTNARDARGRFGSRQPERAGDARAAAGRNPMGTSPRRSAPR